VDDPVRDLLERQPDVHAEAARPARVALAGLHDPAAGPGDDHEAGVGDGGREALGGAEDGIVLLGAGRAEGGHFPRPAVGREHLEADAHLLERAGDDLEVADAGVAGLHGAHGGEDLLDQPLRPRARAAGLALTKTLSKEYAAHNILVNTVCIGRIKAGQWETKAKKEGVPVDKLYRDMGREVPMGRMGEAEEVANVIGFLVSAAASYVTGTSVNLDGGMSGVL